MRELADTDPTKTPGSLSAQDAAESTRREIIFATLNVWRFRIALNAVIVAKWSIIP
jgi:hypothetical protein